MATSDAARTALMAVTVLAPSPLLTGLEGDRGAYATAGAGHFRVANEPR